MAAYPLSHVGGFLLVLIGLSLISLIVLAGMIFLKFGMLKSGGSAWSLQGNVFQGPTEWADINEGADRPPLAAERPTDT